jgi:hypothetical protein
MAMKHMRADSITLEKHKAYHKKWEQANLPRSTSGRMAKSIMDAQDAGTEPTYYKPKRTLFKRQGDGNLQPAKIGR